MLINFEYLFGKYNLNFQGVLHIGANVGEEFEMYNKLGINKQIWIEGNPDIYQVLKENISSNPNAEAHNYIIGDVYLPNVVLHVSNNGSQSSSVLDLKKHMIEHPDVYYVRDVSGPQHRIDELDLDLDGIDFLNIDLQGYDLRALIGIGDQITRFKGIYIEVNKDELYDKCPYVEDIDAYLGLFGYERVETKWAPNKSWGDAFYIKKLGKF